MEEKDVDESIRQECIKSLKCMIEEELNLHSRTDDEFLLRFLRARKYNTERAFKLIKNFYAYRYKHWDIYENLTVDLILEIIRRNYLTILPHADSKGRRILVFRIGPFDPEEFPLPLFVQAIIVALEKIIEYEELQINGVTVIGDLQGFSLTHLTKLTTPSVIYKFVSLIQDCFPFRLKEIHIIFNPALFEYCYAIAKPLLKRKLRKRIRFHGFDISSFHRYLQPDILPEEYGGTQGPIDNTELCTIYQEWQDTWNWNLNEFGYKKTGNS